MASLVSSAFFTSGEVPGFAGEPVGDVVGDAEGLAVADGDGVAGLGLGSSAAGWHAPITATEAARTADNINCLLMIFFLVS